MWHMFVQSRVFGSKVDIFKLQIPELGSILWVMNVTKRVYFGSGLPHSVNVNRTLTLRLLALSERFYGHPRVFLHVVLALSPTQHVALLDSGTSVRVSDSIDPNGHARCSCGLFPVQLSNVVRFLNSSSQMSWRLLRRFTTELVTFKGVIHIPQPLRRARTVLTFWNRLWRHTVTCSL